jgi:molybdate transport system substrate-binding protein
MNQFIFTILLGVALMLGRAVSAAEIDVFAAASLTDSLKAIAADYAQASGDKVVFNFGASSTLARQIEAGAPADIFFSADEKQMDRLAQGGLIDPASRTSRLGNALVVVVPADSSLAVKSAADLGQAGIKQIALADPKAVPAGVYAKAWLEKNQVWTVVEPKVVPTENVRAALAAVESGNVEAGIVYKTDAAISKKIKIAYEVPPLDAPKISYPMALVKSSRPTEAPQKFLAYLGSDAAGQVFVKYGFLLQP